MQASRDIIRVADPWATDLSPLEMQNAETKLRASSSGARRLEIFSKSGQQLVPMRNGQFGPERMVSTAGGEQHVLHGSLNAETSDDHAEAQAW